MNYTQEGSSQPPEVTEPTIASETTTPWPAAPIPTVLNSNPNLNIVSGTGVIVNKNRITNVFNSDPQRNEGTIQAFITAALKARHVPQAVYNAQLGVGCMGGTRVKVLRDIESWIKNQDAPAIFWLTGLAGTGKTAINWTICERVSNDPEILFGGSFFCSRSAGSIAQRDVRCVVPTLAQLLARQSVKFSQALANELARDPDVLHKQVAAQVKQLLYKPLLSLQGSSVPILLVIDALDECGGLSPDEGVLEDTANTRRIVSEMLTALVDFSRSLPRLPVKFLVTSRPETHIRETPVSDSEFSEVLLLHTVNKQQVTTDIHLYISTRISRSTHLRAWFTDNDVNMLARLCDGLFIVATTALQYALCAGTDHATAQFKTLLNSSGDGLGTGAAAPLDRMYALILEDAARVTEYERNELPAMLQLLAALLTARMTLSVAALADLLDRSTRHLRAALSRLHSVVHVPESDHEAGLRTLHASFGDYLRGRAPSHMRIKESFGHDILGRACLQLMADRLHFNVSESRSSHERNPETKPNCITLTLEYACLHWIYHVTSIIDSHRLGLTTGSIWRRSATFMSFRLHNASEIEAYLAEIFYARLLFWLEVMSVLGQVSRAAAMLSIASVAVKSQDLAQFFRDANTFVASSHDAIARSAPHIYLSALPLAAKHSLVYRLFVKKLTGLVSVELGGVDHHGGHLVMNLAGHEGPVNSVSFSSNSLLLGSGSTDGSVRIWDMRTGEEKMAPLRSGDGSVLCCQFASNGTSLVSGTQSGVICVWSILGEHAIPLRLLGHTAAVLSIAWSHHAPVYASGSTDTTVRLWNTETNELCHALCGNHGAVNVVDFSPDGQILASGSEDGTICLWHSTMGELVRQIRDSSRSIATISFSPDGTIAADSHKHSILWDSKTGKLSGVTKTGSGEIKSLQFSPNGRFLVSAEGTHVRLTAMAHATSKEFSTPLIGHRATVRCTTFSPNGLYIASASDDCTIRIWNAEGEKSLVPPSIKHNYAVNSVAVPSDCTFIISASNDCSVSFWDLRTGEKRGSWLRKHNTAVVSVAISLDGQLAASTSVDGAIILWGLQAEMPFYKELLAHEVRVGGSGPLAFSPDSRWLALASKFTGVHIWNIEKFQGSYLHKLACKNHGGAVAVMFSSDSRHIAAGDNLGRIYVWHVETGTLTGEKSGTHLGSVSAVAFSPNTPHIVSCGPEHVARVWHAGSGLDVFHLSGHTDAVCSVAYSPDGGLIATGSKDHAVGLWDAATGVPVAMLRGHTDAVNLVTFTSDGQYVVSCSKDQTIRIFSIDTQAPHSLGSRGEHLAEQICYVDEDGWQMGPSGELLLWVPKAYRRYLKEPPCTLVIEAVHEGVVIGDSGWIHGDNWTSCWRGSTAAPVSHTM